MRRNCYSDGGTLKKMLRVTMRAMAKRNQRIKELKNGFRDHPAVLFMDATLQDLRILADGSAFASVSARAKPEFLVRSDILPGFVVQGGFTVVIADFACVYAAMALSDGHTLLFEAETHFKEKIIEGEIMIAEAHAKRVGERDIETSFIVKNEHGVEKASGTMRYREKKKTK